MRISLCMIVKNEEAVLERCLESVKDLVDEIIIVDTGSDDSTKEIAKKFTDKIFDFEWCDDFSAARNFAFSKGEMDYLMWLDADDYIDEENRKTFADMKKSVMPETDVIMLKYNVGFDENGNVTFSYFRERIVKRSSNIKWKEPVHEHLEIGGQIQQFDNVAITHGFKIRKHSSRNLEIYQSQIKKGNKLSIRGKYYYARELKTHGLHKKAIKVYNDFFKSKNSWIEDRITACCDLSDCYIALNQKDKALETLFKSFVWDTPRAEVCCRVAKILEASGEENKAIFWYETCLSLPRPKSWGFLSEDYWGFIPSIQLCVLYYKNGDVEKARYYHEKSKEIKPGNASVLHNEKFFENL